VTQARHAHLHTVLTTADCHWDALQSLVNLSQQQVGDVLYVRRLYLTKRGLFASERNALIAEMASVTCSIPNARDNITKLSALTSKLQQNAMQDYLVYSKSALLCVEG